MSSFANVEKDIDEINRSVSMLHGLFPQETISKVVAEAHIALIGLESGVIPDSYSMELRSKASFIGVRDKVIKRQGFALLTNEWVDDFAKWINGRRCLEVMSGTGALAKCLKDRGVDIIATDNFSWNEGNNISEFKNFWTGIENIDDVSAIDKYGKDVDIIIMSWPEMESVAYQVLLNMRLTNPNAVLVYIGEGYGGCTADDDFFDIAEYVDDEITDRYPQWYGIHDMPIIYK